MRLLVRTPTVPRNRLTGPVPGSLLGAALVAGALVTGCAGGPSASTAGPTVTVAGTSATESIRGFSEPESVDPAVALTALTHAVQLHPERYAGVSTTGGTTDPLTATVHLVQGRGMSDDVAVFIAAAKDAGIEVSVDHQKHSLAELTATVDVLRAGPPFATQGTNLVSVGINPDTNSVQVVVAVLTADLVSAAAAVYGDLVSVVQGSVLESGVVEGSVVPGAPSPPG
jgi:hypothetical protein